MSDADRPVRRLDDSTRDELARALGNAAPDDTAASDDTDFGSDENTGSGFGGTDDLWADFTPIPEHIDPSVPLAEADEPAFGAPVGVPVVDAPLTGIASVADNSSAGDDSAGDEIEGVRIVEARPSTPPPIEPEEPEERPRPKIIRIDDFAGSHEVPVSSLSAGTQQAADDIAAQAARSDARTTIGSRGDAGATAPAGLAGTGAPRIVTIGDDDLPDAVFIKGSLDEGGQSVIIIDDAGDEAQGPINSPAGTRRSIEPRLRDRRVAVKREAGRRRLRIVALIAAVMVVILGVATVFGSPLFAVQRDNVTVTGAVYTDKAQLDAVIEELVGTPTLRVDTQALESQLNAIPWVDVARVRVRFPHSASIDIRERKAMATYQGPDGQFRVIDDKGRVLAKLDGYPIAYMLVYMPDAPGLDPGQQTPIGLVAAAELTKVLTPELRTRVTSITTVSDGSALELNLSGGTRVLFGSATDLIAKVIRLETRLQQSADDEAAASGTAADGAALPAVIDVSTAETGG